MWPRGFYVENCGSSLLAGNSRTLSSTPPWYCCLVRPGINQVVQLIQHKDPRSLDEALALLQKTVFSFSMKVCGQRQDAEDTMQEVLLKSIPNLSKFDNPKALMVWLYKVAKNCCLMSKRKSKFAPKEHLSSKN